MLKGISSIISPELLKILMEMGHGDELVIGDGNFPAASMSQRLVRADGHGVPALLDAILALFPLDTFVEKPVALMEVVPGDNFQPVIWEEYRKIIQRHEPFTDFEYVERFAFYDVAAKAELIIRTGETRIYGNALVRKGVVPSTGEWA